MAGIDDWLGGVTDFIGEYLLIDTVRVTRPGAGEPVLDLDTGQLTYPDGVIVYEGAGAIVPGSTTMERSAVPDDTQPWTQQTRSTYILLTPWSAPVPPENAIAFVTAVHDPARTALIGRTWICADPGQVSTIEVVRKTALDQQKARLP